jgi:hypothetical protein
MLGDLLHDGVDAVELTFALGEAGIRCVDQGVVM